MAETLLSEALDSINLMTPKPHAALAASLLALAFLAGCSPFDKFEYDSTDPNLPTQPEDWNESQQSYAPEVTGLSCRTNIITGVQHDFSNNTIVSTKEFDMALIGAELLDSGQDGDEFEFHMAPNDSHGVDSFDPHAVMTVETQNGVVLDYEHEDSGDDEQDVKVTLSKGGTKEDVTDSIPYRIGGSRGLLSLPLPKGIITESDSLKSVELTINDQLLARCEPAEGKTVYPVAREEKEASPAAPTSTGSPKQDKYLKTMTNAGIEVRSGSTDTYDVDVKMCEAMRSGEKTAWDLADLERLSTPDDENARRVQLMVPILCPDQQHLVDEALSGDAKQTDLIDGNYIVKQQPEKGIRVVQPGLWETKGATVSDCYYERNDGAGNIIDNNFVNFGQTITVEILPSDGAFISKSCGGWQRVN